MPSDDDDFSMPLDPGQVARYPLPALVIRYTSSRRRRGEIAANTATKIGQILGQFTAVAPADLRKVNAGHVRSFLERYNRSASTQRGHLSVIRNFMKWCVLEGYIKKDPTTGIKPLPQPPSVPGALTGDKSAVLHRTVGQLDPRSRLMVCLEKNEGLRRVELFRMQLSDIDRRGKVVRVRGKARGGRGDVTRNVPLSDETIEALDAYLEHEPTILGIPLASGPLFRSRNRPHDALHIERIGVIVTEALTELGIKQRPGDGVAGHALRHTMATEAIEHGVNRDIVQRFLGHQSSASTDIYTRGAVVELRAVHMARLENRGL